METPIGSGEDSTPQPAEGVSLPGGNDQKVQLIITMHENGRMDFSMPTQKVLAYGMLECARAQIDKIFLIQEAKKEKASRGGMSGLMRRMNGR